MKKQAATTHMIPTRIRTLSALVILLGLILSVTPRAMAASALPSNGIVGYACGYHEEVNGVKRLFVWRDAELSQRGNEWVDARNDQVEVLEIYWSKGSAKIRYPLTNGGYKDRFVPLLALFPTESQNDIKVMKASRRIETYIAMDCSERYGSIAAGDVCYVWGTPQKNALRAVYPIGGSKYKLAFFKASDLSGLTATSYLSGSSASSSSSTSGTTKYVVMTNSNNRLNMRSGPSSSYSIVAKLSYGTQVQVLSTSGSWSKVTASGKTGYVSSQYLSATDPKTDSSSNTSNGLHAPIADGSKFSKKTSDNGWYGYHDINRNVSSNTPVYAIADGTAYFYQYNTNGRLRSYGNYVKFVSSDGQYEVRYAHLSRFNGMRTPITADSAYPCSGAASKGYVDTMKVSAGTTLGWVGTTGNSSGIHLHIEVYKNGVRVDPTSLFPNLV